MKNPSRSETTASITKDPEMGVILKLHQEQAGKTAEGRRRVEHWGVNLRLIGPQELERFKVQVARLEWPA